MDEHLGNEQVLDETDDYAEFPAEKSSFAHAMGVLFNPSAEWPRIYQGRALDTDGHLLYLLIVAALPLFVYWVTLFGFSVPPMRASIEAVLAFYALPIGVLFVVALAINGAAPNFEGTQDFPSALRLAIYASTPFWLASTLAAVTKIPALTLLGAMYSVFIFFLGAPVMMRSPPAKAVVYTILATLVGVFTYFVVVWALLSSGSQPNRSGFTVVCPKDQVVCDAH